MKKGFTLHLFQKKKKWNCLASLKKGEGFTITEMLVAVAIFVLIIFAVYSTYALSQRGYLKGEEIAEITQNGRVILERMTREIRQAREIVTELSDDGSETSSIIEFEDGHITDRYYYIRYYQEDNYIWRKVFTYCFSEDSITCVEPEIYMPWDAVPPTGQSLLTVILEFPRIVGEYVTNLEFWGSRLINISLTLEKKNKGIDLETKIFGRNL